MSPNLHFASTAVPQPEGSNRRRPRGFTLIELLVVIAIAAILTGLAAPSINKMFSSNRVQTEASSFVGDLMYARSEAIKRGLGVSVCASSNGSTCLAANTWNQGWIVFADSTQCNPVPTTAQTALRIRAGFKGTDTMKAAYPAAATHSCVSFNRDGFASNLGNPKVLFAVRNASPTNLTTRCVAIDLVGRVTTQTTASDSSCT